MIDKLRRWLVGEHKAEHPEFDVQERAVIERLATLRHQSPEETLRDARRRALRLEVESMRRQ